MKTTRLLMLCAVASAGAMAAALQACAASGSDGGGTGPGIDSGLIAKSGDSSVDSTLSDDTGVTLDTGSPSIDSGSPSVDSGKAVDSGASGQDSSGEDSSAPIGDAGMEDTSPGDCGSTPALFPGNGQLYCPYGPNGKAIECEAGAQYCCISGKIGGVYPASDCEKISSSGCSVGKGADGGSVQLQCADPATDCPSGDVCCGAPNKVVPIAACGYDRVYDLEYTKCEKTSCLSTELQVCAKSSECPTGKTCVPFKASVDLGYCN